MDLGRRRHHDVTVVNGGALWHHPSPYRDAGSGNHPDPTPSRPESRLLGKQVTVFSKLELQLEVTVEPHPGRDPWNLNPRRQGAIMMPAYELQVNC